MSFISRFSISMAIFFYSTKLGIATNIYADYDTDLRQITVDFRPESIKSKLLISQERNEKLKRSQGILYPIAIEVTEDNGKEDILKELSKIPQKIHANLFHPRSLMFWGVNSKKFLYIRDKFIEEVLKTCWRSANKFSNLSISYEESEFLIKKKFNPSMIADHTKRSPEKNRSNPPRIVIPIRGTHDDKDGKGTFYDHFVFQTITSSPTTMLLPSNTSGEEILRHLRPYAKQLPYGLSYGELELDTNKLLPEVQYKPFFDEGLLVIPGRMRDREDNQMRQDHEEYILRQALRRGQPVLALCAGSWRLWQALWSMTLYPDHNKIDDQKRGYLKEMLKSVTDHSASRMMSLSQTNPKVCYNTMIHGLQLKKNSLLYDLLTYKKLDNFVAPPDNMQVNSVHWKTPQLNSRPINSHETQPFGIDVAATSKNTEELNNKNRSGHIMKPEEKIIEAFSSFYGAPVIGIGWHPEASNKTDDPQMFPQFNHALIRKMTKAGQAYHYKRIVLRELISIFLAARLD